MSSLPSNPRLIVYNLYLHTTCSVWSQLLSLLNAGVYQYEHTYSWSIAHIVPVRESVSAITSYDYITLA